MYLNILMFRCCVFPYYFTIKGGIGKVNSTHPILSYGFYVYYKNNTEVKM